ncbi:MAG: hypothetical protein WCR27_10250 [Eubacteriales bacterium]
MESEVKCPDERMNKLQFDQIKENQKDIYSKQSEHDTRLTVLEKNSILMTSEFANLKQNQDKQSILMLELDKGSREKSDKMFDKVLAAQTKNEENTEKKFEKQAVANKNQYDSQNVLLLKIVEGQNVTKSGKIEISKSRMALLIVIAGVIEVLIQKFL